MLLGVPLTPGCDGATWNFTMFYTRFRVPNFETGPAASNIKKV
jgi:hypothetical protein